MLFTISLSGSYAPVKYFSSIGFKSIFFSQEILDFFLSIFHWGFKLEETDDLQKPTSCRCQQDKKQNLTFFTTIFAFLLAFANAVHLILLGRLQRCPGKRNRTM